eukprot:658818-Rhodomonas_salina.1
MGTPQQLQDGDDLPAVQQRGFPIGFLKALSKFDCKVCALSKGAGVYKHSKHVKLGKAAKKHAKANKNDWQQ